MPSFHFIPSSCDNVWGFIETTDCAQLSACSARGSDPERALENLAEFMQTTKDSEMIGVADNTFIITNATLHSLTIISFGSSPFPIPGYLCPYLIVNRMPFCNRNLPKCLSHPHISVRNEMLSSPLNDKTKLCIKIAAECERTVNSKFVIFCGGLGSGKTTLANRVIQKLWRNHKFHLPIIDPDNYRKSKEYNSIDHEQALETAETVREFLFENQISFAITTTNRTLPYTQKIVGTAKAHGFQPIVVHLDALNVADISSIVSRLADRDSRNRIYHPEIHSSIRRCRMNVDAIDPPHRITVSACGRTTPTAQLVSQKIHSIFQFSY